jgi:hypothetical protein
VTARTAGILVTAALAACWSGASAQDPLQPELEEGGPVKSPIQIGPAERAARGPEGPVGVARPRSPEEVQALGLRQGPPSPPAYVVLARGEHGPPPPTLEVHTVDGAPAAVLTFHPPAPGEGHGQGIGPVVAWCLEAPRPLRLLVRTGAGPIAKSGASVAATGRPPALALKSPARPVTLAPCGGEPPEAVGLTEELLATTAVFAARPAAGGGPRLLGAAALPGTSPETQGVRVSVALPVGHGTPAWGPRDGDPEALTAPRPGAGPVEWLLVLE